MADSNSNSNYFWTDKEVEILKESYANGGLKTAVERLSPGKSRGTIATQASRLQITKAKPRNKSGFSMGSSDDSDSGYSGVDLSGKMGT